MCVCVCVCVCVRVVADGAARRGAHLSTRKASLATRLRRGRSTGRPFTNLRRRAAFAARSATIRGRRGAGGRVTDAPKLLVAQRASGAAHGPRHGAVDAARTRARRYNFRQPHRFAHDAGRRQLTGRRRRARRATRAAAARRARQTPSRRCDAGALARAHGGAQARARRRANDTCRASTRPDRLSPARRSLFCGERRRHRRRVVVGARHARCVCRDSFEELRRRVDRSHRQRFECVVCASVALVRQKK